MADKAYVVLGKKHGTFKDDSGKEIPFSQLALDCGNYLKVFKVKESQSSRLDSLVPGSVLTDDELIIADKLAVLL